MFLMFARKQPDMLPTGDYGVQMAIRKHSCKSKSAKPAQMENLACAWARTHRDWG